MLRPSVASSLFPRLHHRSLTPFRIGLVALVLALVAFAVLRWQAPLVAVSALGLPVLFHLYLVETGAYQDLPRRALLAAAVLAVALGVGWAWLTGEIIARSYDVAFGSGIEFKQPLWVGVAVPAGGALVMLIPALLAHAARVGSRKSLDGFVVGAVTAMAFTAAATLTRLAPQFFTGLVTHRPLGVLIAEAGIRGVAISLTAAAAGGMVGAALWFTRPAPQHQRPGQALAGPLPSLVFVVVTYAVLGLVDASPAPQAAQLVVHLGLALVVMVALRLVVHMALLREAHDPFSGEPLRCQYCARVVPDMAFCPHCGVAAQASSRSSRTSPHRLLLQLGGGVGVLIMAMVLAFTVVTPAPARYVCPPDCGQPPIGKPVQRLPRFTSPDGAFSVAYPAEGTAYDVTLKPNGVIAEFTGGDGGTMQLVSEPANGRSPAEIAQTLLDRTYPDAVKDYEIPNAMVGYQLGYGEVADVYPQDAAGKYMRLRLVILVAVKNGLALVAGAVGPFRRFTPDFGPGQPSAANLQLALDMGQYVNSFMWRGDPPR